MALIEWDEKLSVKVAKIDKQHQQLIGLINQLHQGMLERKTKEVLTGIIDGLIQYTSSHFSTEESYFAQFAYPKGTAHTEEHAAFVKKVLAFKHDFEEGKVLLSMEIMSFLKEWLVIHIQGSDKEYTECFNSNGLL